MSNDIRLGNKEKILPKALNTREFIDDELVLCVIAK